MTGYRVHFNICLYILYGCELLKASSWEEYLELEDRKWQGINKYNNFRSIIFCICTLFNNALSQITWS